MNHDHNGLFSPGKLVFLGFLLVGGFFLLTEHRAHLFGVLPFLLLLACPLMHLFGHDHGGHGQSKADHEPEAARPNYGAAGTPATLALPTEPHHAKSD